MPNNKTGLLFVHGVQKTGTSTLVGMLNSHPEIFLLYETRMDRSMVSKYGNQLLDHLPETRKFFRYNENIGEPYLALAKYLSQQNPNTKYRYIGDKIISFNPEETQPPLPHKTIYAIRDARTWLCKEQNVRWYRTDLDVVGPAVDYLRYIMQSYRFQNSLHVRLEDIVLKNDQVISNMSEYLDLDLSTYAEKWWENIGQYEENDPKSYVEWYLGHASSKTEPKKLDTSVDMIPQPFWQDYLPLFDKYFQVNSAAELSESTLNVDMQKLERLLEHSPLPLEECYRNIDSQILSLEQNLSPQRSIINKVKKLIAKVIS